MKILFVSAILPYPLYSGGQIRIFNLLKQLTKKHTIHLFSFIRTEEEKKEIHRLSFCQQITVVHRGHAWQLPYLARSIVGKYPFLLSTYDNNEMKRSISDALSREKYDIVHIEPGYVWPSMPAFHVPLVVSEHNVEHEVYEGYVKRIPVGLLRPVLSWDVDKLRKWEKNIWKKATEIITVSDEDKQKIQGLSGLRNISVVPNGVDLTQFPFKPKKADPTVGPICLFVGNFSWLQNRDAVKYILQDVWPAVIRSYPLARLRIVGRHVPSSIRGFGNQPSVIFLEHVDDIQDELNKTDIMLAPIRVGGGTKYKILEAMASGLSVVTTTLGARGLHVQHGKELLIADDVSHIVTSISRIMSDAKTRNVIQRNARQRIEKEYSWDRIAGLLERVWATAYEGR